MCASMNARSFPRYCFVFSLCPKFMRFLLVVASRPQVLRQSREHRHGKRAEYRVERQRCGAVRPLRPKPCAGEHVAELTIGEIERQLERRSRPAALADRPGMLVTGERSDQSRHDRDDPTVAVTAGTRDHVIRALADGAKRQVLAFEKELASELP